MPLRSGHRKLVTLDRGLVAGIHGNRRQQILVRACRDLGATVVAEGIETPEEYDAIKEVGAELGQGYFFTRAGFPMPAIGWQPSSDDCQQSF